MDTKTDYSSNVSAMKQIADIDAGLAKELEKGAERARRFHSNWQSVNINEVVEKFAPGAVAYQKGGKIIFESSDHTIAIIADAAGGYLRIQDLTSKTRRALYLTLEGKNAHNVTIDGKTRGRTTEEYEIATHFRIKKREEM